MVFLCCCTFSPFNSIMSAGPWKTKNSHRGWSDVRINTSKYNCGVTRGAVGFLFPASTWNSKNRETILILVLWCAQFTVQNLQWSSMQNTTLTSHYMPNRTEGMVIGFFLSHSTSSGREWMNLNMKHSNSCLLCYSVYDYCFFYSTSQLHMAHCNCSISLHSVWHYLLSLALLAPTQDRGSAKKQCLETMLARWKEWEKIKKRKSVWERFFFLQLSMAF